MTAPRIRPADEAFAKKIWTSLGVRFAFLSLLGQFSGFMEPICMNFSLIGIEAHPLGSSVVTLK